MNRNITSFIRFVMDECLPPCIRDNRWFMLPFYFVAYRGRNVRKAMDFKRDVVRMTPEEYNRYYASISSISRDRDTDLNTQCIAQIRTLFSELPGGRVLDAGSGSGFIARLIRDEFPGIEVVSLDIVPPPAPVPGEFFQASLHALPFAAGSFDLVLCCHALEHCLNLDRVVAELKRVCRGELVVVVPRQRRYYYTLDEHVQFFLYEEQLTTAIGLPQHQCLRMGGDWFYRGSLSATQDAAPPSLSLNPSR